MAVLGWIYTEATPPVEASELPALMRAASFFLLPDLHAECLKVAQAALSVYTALDWLLFAVQHRDEALKSAAQQYVAANYELIRLCRPQQSAEQLRRLCALDPEVAQAADFVSSMSAGLESPIDQGGTNVSGGQRQRLCIARALVKDSPAYLFDDCFSALDAATDARLRQALRAGVGAATVLIVAQRVSTIMDADQIIVLDGGRAVGIGDHRQLVATCPTYREIVVSQLGEGATR